MSAFIMHMLAVVQLLLYWNTYIHSFALSICNTHFMRVNWDYTMCWESSPFHGFGRSENVGKQIGVGLWHYAVIGIQGFGWAWIQLVSVSVLGIRPNQQTRNAQRESRNRKQERKRQIFYLVAQQIVEYFHGSQQIPLCIYIGCCVWQVFVSHGLHYQLPWYPVRFQGRCSLGTCESAADEATQGESGIHKPITSAIFFILFPICWNSGAPP